MVQQNSVTFRDQTANRISDLLEDEGLQCLQSQNLLNFLTGTLLNYRDEGVEFSPLVIFCKSITRFLTAFPGSVAHVIGEAALNASSGRKILKDCAPLASQSWHIFIERTDGGALRYGVFTYFKLPTAIPLHEGITIDPNEFSVLVRKRSSSTIEIRGAKGSILNLIFSTVREAETFGTPIDEFAALCCSRILDQRIKAPFQTYFSRLIENVLTSSHGTIFICRDSEAVEDIQEMQDAVAVTPILDFQSAFAEFLTADTAGAILALQRCEELLHGFTRCDGMVMFDCRGQVTAYRVFYRPVKEIEMGNVVGGARRRAFEGVRLLVGETIKSALFRSQDGMTIFHGAAQ
jgi:hypothetical protein